MEAANFASPDNQTPMSAPGADGQPRFWVLEVHVLQDPAVGTCAPSSNRGQGMSGSYPSTLTLITWPPSVRVVVERCSCNNPAACRAHPAHSK